MDDLDETLRNARAKTDDPAVVAAVHALAAARTRRTPRRRRILAPAISVGAALVLVGGGAMAVGGWAPWNIADPDISFTRAWADVDGDFVGFCETRFKSDQFPTTEIQEAARAYLADLDIANMTPDAEHVAARLLQLDRPNDLPTLIAGAKASDYDVRLVYGPQPDPSVTDAEILQEGLALKVSRTLGEYLLARWPSELSNGVESNSESQCSTDPTETPAP